MGIESGSCGLLPLFPLQTVLFPGGVLALKVFEARYVDLITRCLREGSAFGVICLRQGREAGRGPIALEPVGTLAHIDEVDGEQVGILQVRCHGGQRVVLDGEPVQQKDGLWMAPAKALSEDTSEPPAAAMQGCVQALAQVIANLQAQGPQAVWPFRAPLRLDDAGWVANRWCEMLPIPLGAKQKLMALESPALRLQIVDDYLRSKQVIA